MTIKEISQAGYTGGTSICSINIDALEENLAAARANKITPAVTVTGLGSRIKSSISNPSAGGEAEKMYVKEFEERVCKIMTV